MSEERERENPTEIGREEFIRRRPEVSPEQGSGAGPGAPETVEPTQGQRPGAEDREDDR